MRAMQLERIVLRPLAERMSPRLRRSPEPNALGARPQLRRNGTQIE